MLTAIRGQFVLLLSPSHLSSVWHGLQVGRGHSLASSLKAGADRVEGHIQGLALQDIFGQPSQVMGECWALAHMAL